MSDSDTAPSRFVVDSTRIREYARAVSAHHPAHWCEKAAAALGFSGLVAPPTFATLAWEQARSEIMNSLTARFQADRIVHVDQVLEAGRPLLAGDVLDFRIHRETFHHFRDYDIVAIISVLTDQDGIAVQRGTTTLLTHTAARVPEAPSALGSVAEGFELAPPSGAIRGPHTAISFNRLWVGSQLPCVTRRLTPGSMTAFARLTNGTFGYPPTTASKSGSAVGSLLEIHSAAP